MSDATDVALRVQVHLNRFNVDFDEQGRDAVRALLQYVSEEPVCPHCCLRYMNWENIGLCAEEPTVIRSVLAGILGRECTPNDAQQQCKACLGVLAYVARAAFKDEIYETIVNSGYTFSSYLLTVTTPVYLLVSDALCCEELRQRGLLIAQRRGQDRGRPVRGAEEGVAVPVKRMAKLALGPHLTPRLGVPVDH